MVHVSKALNFALSVLFRGFTVEIIMKACKKDGLSGKVFPKSIVFENYLKNSHLSEQSELS